MRRSRSGRPSLLGTAARTAVIAGTATAVSGAVAGSQQQRAMAQQAAAAPQAVVQPQPPAVGGGLSEEAIARLQQLGNLHQSGVLTDDEFAAAKAKILTG